jgi:hypothetical protein
MHLTLIKTAAVLVSWLQIFRPQYYFLGLAIKTVNNLKRVYSWLSTSLSMIIVRFFVPFDWQPKIKSGLGREEKKRKNTLVACTSSVFFLAKCRELVF